MGFRCQLVVCNRKLIFFLGVFGIFRQALGGVLHVALPGLTFSTALRWRNTHRQALTGFASWVVTVTYGQLGLCPFFEPQAGVTGNRSANKIPHWSPNPKYRRYNPSWKKVTELAALRCGQAFDTGVPTMGKSWLELESANFGSGIHRCFFWDPSANHTDPRNVKGWLRKGLHRFVICIYI